MVEREEGKAIEEFDVLFVLKYEIQMHKNISDWSVVDDKKSPM